MAKSRNKRQTDTSNDDKKARQSIGTQKSLIQTLDNFSTKKNLSKSKTARGEDLKEVV